jgi:hypothetical protein
MNGIYINLTNVFNRLGEWSSENLEGFIVSNGQVIPFKGKSLPQVREYCHKAIPEYKDNSFQVYKITS